MQVRLVHKGRKIVIDIIDLDDDGPLTCEYTYKGEKYQAKAAGITQVANMIKRQVEEVDKFYIQTKEDK